MARSFLIEKARTEIRRKLKEMKSASGACSKHGKPRKGNLGSSHSGLKKIGQATPVVLLEAAKDSQADASDDKVNKKLGKEVVAEERCLTVKSTFPTNPKAIRDALDRVHQ
ncbi:hypothetical protein Nepgr_022338 [Nepenthes gracilis]|uniref:Uncharacterized protein n=1 Tax=Nepenthes gracilis TaxID=150966 RepID=A0AAD3T0R3_NEPGR|nr:hypothetical protein Nepgr_022338 [Nepenthes gracilis]